MKARSADHEGFVTRDGVRTAYYVYENTGPTVLLMPTWSIVHSQHWKAQVPYLSRHFRVVTFDGRGNGASDRPRDPRAYNDQEFVADALAVLDETGTPTAFIAGVSMGAHWSALLAGLHADRVAGAILIDPTTSLTAVPHPKRTLGPFEDSLSTNDGWGKYNEHYWRTNYADFAEFFFSQVFSEPHSTKQREDAVEWALETDPETLIAAEHAEQVAYNAEQVLSGIRCPVLVIHGTEDRISYYRTGEALAAATGGTVLLIEGGGHLPQTRDPVQVNLAIKRFVDRVAA